MHSILINRFRVMVDDDKVLSSSMRDHFCKGLDHCSYSLYDLCVSYNGIILPPKKDHVRIVLKQRVVKL